MDTQTSTATQAAKTIRLADYQPPAWRVTHAELKFELGLDETRVHSRLTLARDRAEPLRLDGEDLELVGARLDGRTLTAGDYRLDASGLVIADARDGSVLELDVRMNPARNSGQLLIARPRKERHVRSSQLGANGNRQACRSGQVGRGAAPGFP